MEQEPEAKVIARCRPSLPQHAALLQRKEAIREKKRRSEERRLLGVMRVR